MQSDIQIYGIKRSGHNAVAFWIIGHYNNYIYYSNCRFDGKKLIAPYCFKKGPSKQTVVLSFEDIRNGPNIKKLAKLLPKPRKRRVLVIRDPFNNYASRFKARVRYPEAYKDIYDDTNIWKDLAKEYLGITSYFGSNTIKINYNEWFRSLSYRKELSTNFGKFTDANFEFVPDIGGGSSFDRRKHNGNTNEMDIIHRWRNYINDERFISIIKDEELLSLSNQIFGNIFKI